MCCSSTRGNRNSYAPCRESLAKVPLRVYPWTDEFLSEMELSGSSRLEEFLKQKTFLCCCSTGCRRPSFSAQTQFALSRASEWSFSKTLSKSSQKHPLPLMLLKGPQMCSSSHLLTLRGSLVPGLTDMGPKEN